MGISFDISISLLEDSFFQASELFSEIGGREVVSEINSPIGGSLSMKISLSVLFYDSGNRQGD
jgi:hypothetical protein